MLASGAAVDAGVCGVNADEGPQHRPAAGAAQGRGVRARLVGLVEAVGGAVRQKDPGGGEIAGRVTGEEVAEVDHAGESAVRGQDIGRVPVAVEPQTWACPFGCGGVFPDRADGAGAPDHAQLGGRGELPGEVLGGAGQRAPAAAACGRRLGGRAMEGGQEGGQSDGRLRGARCGGAVCGLAGYPGGDEPGPREPFGGLTDALRDGDLQRKVRGEERQPGVFLAQQRVRGLRRPGRPDGEVAAEPPHLIVPARRSELQGVICQVGVLLAQQVPDQNPR